MGELYAFDPKTYAVLVRPEDLPLKICYSVYTHDPVDFSLPRRVVVNGSHQCHWRDWPQPDTSVWMWFTICSEDELYEALNRMKPRGDEEQIIFGYLHMITMMLKSIFSRYICSIKKMLKKAICSYMMNCHRNIIVVSS